MYGLKIYDGRDKFVRPAELFNIVDYFFEDMFRQPGRQQIQLDIKENDQGYILEAEIPGIEKDNLNIEVKDNRIKIEVQREEVKGEETNKYIYRERKFGSLSRMLTLPENIAEKEIKARYENGILTIDLPKKGSDSPRKIAVN